MPRNRRAAFVMKLLIPILIVLPLLFPAPRASAQAPSPQVAAPAQSAPPLTTQAPAQAPSPEVAPAAPQASGPVTKVELERGEVPLRFRLKLGFVAVGGATAGVAAAALAGGLVFLGLDRSGRCEGDDSDQCLGVTGGVFFLSVLTLPPISAALLVHHVGKRGGYQVRRWIPYAGAFAGLGIGIALETALLAGLEGGFSYSAGEGAFIGTTAVIMLGSIASATTLSYLWSARRAPQLAPVLTPVHGGLSAGVLGRF